MAKKPKLLSDQVRQAIEESGVSRYRIAQETGVSQTALSLFVNGHRGLGMEALDAVGKFLGLRVVADKKRTKREGK